MDFGKISEKQIWRLFLTDDDRFLFSFDGKHV